MNKAEQRANDFIKTTHKVDRPVDAGFEAGVEFDAYVAGYEQAIKDAAQIAQDTHDEQGLGLGDFKDGARYAALEIKEWIEKQNEEIK